jgi:hypothetical protein
VNDIRAYTDHWIAGHFELYSLFVEAVLTAASKQQVTGIGKIAEDLRWGKSPKAGGEQYKVPNQCRAYIARRIVEQYPHVKPYLRFRPTRDELVGAASTPG